MHRGISLYIYFHETYAFTLKRLMLFFKLGIRDEDGQFSQIPNKRIMDYHKKVNRFINLKKKCSSEAVQSLCQ